MREVHLKILQYVTAIGIFFVVGVHLLVSHFGSGDSTSWVSVVKRATSSGWFALYIFILIFGFYHTLNGLRTIILEFSLPQRAIKVLDWTLVLGGLAVFGYAIYIPIKAF